MGFDCLSLLHGAPGQYKAAKVLKVHPGRKYVDLAFENGVVEEDVLVCTLKFPSNVTPFYVLFSFFLIKFLSFVGMLSHLGGSNHEGEGDSLYSAVM